MAEITSLGAAMAAGYAKGVEVWDIDKIQAVPSDQFIPRICEDSKLTIIILTLYILIHSFYSTERDIRYNKWKMAIARSLDWTTTDQDTISKGKILT